MVWPAETHIRQPVAPFGAHQQQAMRARGDRLGRPIPQHAPGKVRDLEAQRAQCVAEQQVLLEAPAAATLLHELAFDHLRIEADAPAEEGVQVLEGRWTARAAARARRAWPAPGSRAPR